MASSRYSVILRCKCLLHNNYCGSCPYLAYEKIPIARDRGNRIKSPISPDSRGNKNNGLERSSSARVGLMHVLIVVEGRFRNSERPVAHAILKSVFWMQPVSECPRGEI